MPSSKKSLSIVERRNAWDYRFGSECGRATCVVCLKKHITQMDHTVGHIVAESKGGSSDPDNLIPICDGCNRAMGSTEMCEFTKKIYKRDLVIPQFVEGAPLANILLVEDVRIAEFVTNNFIYGSTYTIKRKTLIDYVKESIYGIHGISLEEIFIEIEKQSGISLSVPSAEIKGLSIKSIEEEKRKKIKENVETEIDIFMSFFNECYIKESTAGPITAKQVRETFNEWKKYAGKCDLTLTNLLKLMKNWCGIPSTEKEFWGVREVGEDLSGNLFRNIP